MSEVILKVLDHPPLTVSVVAICMYFVAVSIIQFFMSLSRRFFGTIKVVCCGWPPEHLDADGDWKPEPATEDDE